MYFFSLVSFKKPLLLYTLDPWTPGWRLRYICTEHEFWEMHSKALATEWIMWLLIYYQKFQTKFWNIFKIKSTGTLCSHPMNSLRFPYHVLHVWCGRLLNIQALNSCQSPKVISIMSRSSAISHSQSTGPLIWFSRITAWYDGTNDNWIPPICDSW